jgi:FSR family fosmidomycin resistance protein-like MFS transporter
MSVFAVGGNLGFALAPAVVAVAVGAVGLHGTALAAVLPAAGAAALGLVLWTRRRQIAEAHVQARSKQAGEDLWGPFWRLATSACLRSGVYFGLQSFVAVYFVERYGTSSSTGDAALTVILFSGVVGTLCGGLLADVIGRRAILIGSMALIVPFLVAFLFVGEALAFPLLAVVGFCTVANMSVTVVMGQEYLPNRLGTASGIMLGLAISLGGGIAWLFGLLADATSVRTVMFVIAALPLFAVLAAIGLPETGPQPRGLRRRRLVASRA